MNLRTRRLDGVTELYLCAGPVAPSATAELFRQIGALLAERGACILEERIFAQGDEADRLELERRAGYGALDDGVAPSWLVSPRGRSGDTALTLHAVAGAAPSRIDEHGRLLRWEHGALVTLSGLTVDEGPAGQPFLARAEAVFARARELLERGGSTLRQVARTWLWVDPIEARYADLNRARTACFVEAGLIGGEGAPAYLPASTGIGLRPRIGELGLDAIAACGDERPEGWLSLGNQRSAFAYGSAFGRASRLGAPGGPTIYLSGTAAIDRAGRTIAPGDPTRQIRATLENVRAALAELGIGEQEIVQGVAFAASEAVAALWRGLSPGWPLIPVLADICRPELLFEIEVTAWPGAL